MKILNRFLYHLIFFYFRIKYVFHYCTKGIKQCRNYNVFKGVALCKTCANEYTNEALNKVYKYHILEKINGFKAVRFHTGSKKNMCGIICTKCDSLVTWLHMNKKEAWEEFRRRGHSKETCHILLEEKIEADTEK